MNKENIIQWLKENLDVTVEVDEKHRYFGEDAGIRVSVEVTLDGETLAKSSDWAPIPEND